ncbi:LuxR C-terminal-related transcriptional regulator [Cellulomonas sp. NPDC055163]
MPQRRAAPGPAPAVGVTERQLTILRLLAAGLSDHDAAAAAYVGERTLQRDLARLMRMLRVDNRFQLGWEVARRGWLEGPPRRHD